MPQKRPGQSSDFSSLTIDGSAYATHRGPLNALQDFEQLQASIKQREMFGKPADSGFPKKCSVRRGDGGDDFRTGALNVFERLGEKILVARVQGNVFGG
jgi:hypothetical protein